MTGIGTVGSVLQTEGHVMNFTFDSTYSQKWWTSLIF